jgi:hypothetical protein
VRALCLLLRSGRLEGLWFHLCFNDFSSYGCSAALKYPQPASLPAIQAGTLPKSTTQYPYPTKDSIWARSHPHANKRLPPKKTPKSPLHLPQTTFNLLKVIAHNHLLSLTSLKT